MNWLKNIAKKIAKKNKRSSIAREVGKFSNYFKKKSNDSSSGGDDNETHSNNDSSANSNSSGGIIPAEDVEAGAVPTNSGDSSGDSPNSNSTEANNAIEEGIRNAYFAKYNYNSQISTVELGKIDKGAVRDEVHIIINAFNLAGKEATITIHEKEALLVAQDAPKSRW